MNHSVCVIIPAYNCTKSIFRCLSSISAQTYPVSEVIVIDDFSSDGLEANIGIAAKKILNLKIIYHRLEKNSGPGTARNIGIKLSKSEIVSFVDADDYWLPDHLKTAIEIIELCGLKSTVVVHRPIQEKALNTDAVAIKFHEFSWLYYLFIQRNCSIITLVSHRELIESTPLFPDQFRHAEDFEFFIFLFRNALKRVCIDSPRTAVIGKHAFASGAGLSSNLHLMYLGTLRAIYKGLSGQSYLPLIWLLVIWHTVKYLIRRIRVKSENTIRTLSR